MRDKSQQPIKQHITRHLKKEKNIIGMNSPQKNMCGKKRKRKKNSHSSRENGSFFIRKLL
jgi:hypothetical protein